MASSRKLGGQSVVIGILLRKIESRRKRATERSTRRALVHTSATLCGRLRMVKIYAWTGIIYTCVRTNLRWSKTSDTSQTCCLVPCIPSEAPRLE